MSDPGPSDAPAAPAQARETLLSVNEVDVVYGGVIQALRDISLEVRAGEVVSLVGANGAGKTSLLRAITGLLPHHNGRVTSGRIHLRGDDITGLSSTAIVSRGVALSMEGRRVFAELSVDENLRSGAHTVRDRRSVRLRADSMMEMFPILGQRRHSQAGYLSGGEQQMLAIARALMSGPSLLLLDEPSLGLAPLIVQQIWQIIGRVNAEGTTVLLVEQNAAMALSISDRAYVLDTGRLAKTGTGAALRDDPEIRALYLGMGEEGTGRRSYRSDFRARQAAQLSNRKGPTP